MGCIGLLAYDDQESEQWRAVCWSLFNNKIKTNSGDYAYTGKNKIHTKTYYVRNIWHEATNDFHL